MYCIEWKKVLMYYRYILTMFMNPTMHVHIVSYCKIVHIVWYINICFKFYFFILKFVLLFESKMLLYLYTIKPKSLPFYCPHESLPPRLWKSHNFPYHYSVKNLSQTICICLLSFWNPMLFCFFFQGDWLYVIYSNRGTYIEHLMGGTHYWRC